ncbi:MAG: hybrid sensor histidine kinase/response regulator [Desulfobacterales bacterium]|nr:hybrid sensor histidine kinase/response regulator [Desulfobacterales bacterium]
MPTVLFVDDERVTLNVLKRLLADETYDMVFTDSGEKALEVLAKRPVAVIVTDLEMPEMDGFALLATIREKYPDTIRLALSAHDDGDYLIGAINTGQVYRYIIKPWNNQALKVTVNQALALFGVQQENRDLLARLGENNRVLEARVAKRTRQLLAVEKQAEVGKHAAYIVHNLNGPLQALRSGLELAGIQLADSPQNMAGVKKHLKAIRNGLDDIEQIVADILGHVRDERFFQTVRVDINEVVRRELSFFNLNPVFKREMEKVVDLAPDLPPILGNALQIKQILDNLIVNAIDAMETVDEKTLRIATRVEDGGTVITVADSGTGIAESDLSHIFRPDFTTKPVGKGTGLGLASVKSMVDAYGGRIEVTSLAGQGTVFKVWIPAVTDPA